MAVRPDSKKDHACEWRDRAESLEGEVASLHDTLAKVQQELASLTRRVLGPKSEKMPPIAKETRDGPVPLEEVQKKRRERRKQKAKLETKTTFTPVPDDQRSCPKCGGDKLRPLGEGKVSTLYEFIPARFIAHRQVRETLACPCGEHVVTAEGPAHWQEKSRYAPSFVAHLITAKCADSIPLYRLEKEYQRTGVCIARSTMTDLFHRAAEVLAPIWNRLIEIIRLSEIVHADETSLRVQQEKACRNGFVWTFRTTWPRPLIAFKFSPSRSGETPKQLLGGTGGCLVVDGYSGYNVVTDVDGRKRIGCWAHVRRYFFEAMTTAPEAREALDFIRDMYRVEAHALEAGVLRTDAHLKLRQTTTRPLVEALEKWLIEKQGLHPPKSPLGVAIRYTRNLWDALLHFLGDAKVPLDNNPAEAALRRVALGRKNFLFVGHDDAGDNLAGLYSVVATCEANGVNPLEYLADVLVRVNTHPNKQIDELLPHLWGGGAAVAA